MQHALKLYQESFEQSRHFNSVPCKADVVGTAAFVDKETNIR